MQDSYSYDLLRPLHKLWLGYISELLNLALRTETEPTPSQAGQSEVSEAGVAGSSSMSLDAPAPVQSVGTQQQSATTSQPFSLQQMQAWQSKLVKADFHGCDVEGELRL